MNIESALEKFWLDTQDFDEGLLESEDFLIDFGLSQFSEVSVGPRVACFWEREFHRPDPYLPYKVPTCVLMAMLESITQGLNIFFGVDATDAGFVSVSVHN